MEILAKTEFRRPDNPGLRHRHIGSCSDWKGKNMKNVRQDGHLESAACLWFVPPAAASVIDSCTVASATAGESLTSCTFGTAPIGGGQTGDLTIDKLFTVTVPGSDLDVDLGLNTSVSGIYVYTVTENIVNDSPVTWTNFEISVPNASSLTGPTVTGGGLSTCNLSGESFSCFGGGGEIAEWKYLITNLLSRHTDRSNRDLF